MRQLRGKGPQSISFTEGEGTLVYRMENETGKGLMTVHSLLPGVVLSYNDFHMRYFESEFHTGENLLCIDHCREGRLEYARKEAFYSYVEGGDLKIDRRLHHTGRFSFPLSHYHGITVMIHLPLAITALAEEFHGVPVDLPGVQRKFCNDGNPLVLHEPPSIDHIFSELYAVPKDIKLSYCKLKVLELLLYLEALELPEGTDDRPYFYRPQVEKVKAIMALMTEHPEHRYTLETLSRRFDIPLTPMKRCFKSVYGKPINTYMRIYRMNAAAVMLRQERSIGIAEIAGRVGYDSPSKFASAFRAIMGKAPLEYRNAPE